jgi:myosin heavy subunit
MIKFVSDLSMVVFWCSAIPQGFVDGKVVSEKVLLALQLDPAEYRLGNTKVFFKAGVVGNLENMRDERLSTIISTFL